MKVDESLIEACIKGDRLAQSELYRQCFHILMGICTRYVNNQQDAVEQLNEGFLKILKSLHKRKKSAPLEAWLKRIMINTMIDFYRKQKKYKEKVFFASDVPDEPHFNQQQVLNEAAVRMDAERLELCIKRLPDMTQQVFNLFCVDGYSHKEISKLMGISVGTSKWHVSHGRSLLKSMIAQFIQNEQAYEQRGG